MSKDFLVQGNEGLVDCDELEGGCGGVGRGTYLSAQDENLPLLSSISLSANRRFSPLWIVRLPGRRCSASSCVSGL